MVDFKEFEEAHAQWNRETCIHSFPWTILKGAGFEKIKSFGKDAIPFLLRKLEESLISSTDVQVWGIHFHLEELTGEHVVVAEIDDGFVKCDVEATTKAWIKWGKEHKYIG